MSFTKEEKSEIYLNGAISNWKNYSRRKTDKSNDENSFEILGNKLSAPIDIVMEACCFALDCSEQDVKTKVKTRELVMARRLYSVYLYANTYFTLQHIGKLLGRDHSTVVSYEKKYIEYRDTKYPFQVVAEKKFLGYIKRKGLEYSLSMDTSHRENNGNLGNKRKPKKKK